MPLFSEGFIFDLECKQLHREHYDQEYSDVEVVDLVEDALIALELEHTIVIEHRGEHSQCQRFCIEWVSKEHCNFCSNDQV